MTIQDMLAELRRAQEELDILAGEMSKAMAQLEAATERAEKAEARAERAEKDLAAFDPAAIVGYGNLRYAEGQQSVMARIPPGTTLRDP